MEIGIRGWRQTTCLILIIHAPWTQWLGSMSFLCPMWWHRAGLGRFLPHIYQLSLGKTIFPITLPPHISRYFTASSNLFSSKDKLSSHIPSFILLLKVIPPVPPLKLLHNSTLLMALKLKNGVQNTFMGIKVGSIRDFSISLLSVPHTNVNSHINSNCILFCLVSSTCCAWDTAEQCTMHF